MTELTALLTKALLSTTFGVSREQRYSADELRDALARASGRVSENGNLAEIPIQLSFFHLFWRFLASFSPVWIFDRSLSGLVRFTLC